ncbi:MAG: FAD-binding protein, partial [Rhodospirillaceae bacterium]|nr:FAD-binding protein [Rhodospirillaceae bacterium]
MLMPKPEADILAQRQGLIADLRQIVSGEGVIADEIALRVYESDGLSAYRQTPMAVVLPETVAQISDIMRLCDQRGVKIVPRGAGTSLSGGALPLEDGIILGLGKFNRILEIDYENRAVRVQPGVTNLGISQAVDAEGFYYAPDPSSQIACSIGGNVAENAGGVHCLKYGVTTNNLLGLEMVLLSGEVIRLGGKHLDSGGYDLMGLLTGSEGLLGVITEITVRILKKPETARALLIGFPSSEAAGACVGQVIGSGIIPGGMEMMDKAAIHASEEFCHAGYPLEAEALLIVELDGPGREVDHLIEKVGAIAEGCGSTSLRISETEAER